VTVCVCVCVCLDSFIQLYNTHLKPENNKPIQRPEAQTHTHTHTHTH